MNERIRELAEQAGARHDSWGRFDLDDFQYKKFAQLIIRECALVCLEDKDSQRILEHFGVEISAKLTNGELEPESPCDGMLSEWTQSQKDELSSVLGDIFGWKKAST